MKSNLGNLIFDILDSPAVYNICWVFMALRHIMKYVYLCICVFMYSYHGILLAILIRLNSASGAESENSTLLNIFLMLHLVIADQTSHVIADQMRRALHSTWLGGRWLVTLWPDYKSTYSVLMTNIILTYWWLGWPDCLDGADEADLTVDGKVVICTIHIQRELLFCFFVKSYFFSNKKITSSAFRHIWCG